jgi:NAD+ kinase
VAAHRKADKDPLGINMERDHGGHTESRLLTKKQLSDMAIGIRELSKKLSHVQLKLKIRNIFLLVKAHDETLIAHTRQLSEWLLRNNAQFTVYVTARKADFVTY